MKLWAAGVEAGAAAIDTARAYVTVGDAAASEVSVSQRGEVLSRSTNSGWNTT